MKFKDVEYNTEINKLYRYQIEKIVDLAINWCIMNLGQRKWCPNVFVEVVKEEVTNGAGWYLAYRHDPEIAINANGNLPAMDLVDTVIHEYAHYLQPNFQETYDQLSTEYEYYNNPLEVEARETARKYRKKCFTEIKKDFKYGRI